MYFKYILFCSNVISYYREREYTWNTLFSFGIMPIFQYFQMDFATSKQRFRKKWLKSLQCRIISAFQNCSKFVNRTYFGKRFIVLNNPNSPTTYFQTTRFFNWFQKVSHGMTQIDFFKVWQVVSSQCIIYTLICTTRVSHKTTFFSGAKMGPSKFEVKGDLMDHY